MLNDPDNGRYAGILQLKIGDIVTVTAIGLVTTKLPDGSPGFSLLVIITATFPRSSSDSASTCPGWVACSASTAR
ncbi:hypothetical protein GCM10027614_82220 [Micromonospora vulcania]